MRSCKCQSIKTWCVHNIKAEVISLPYIFQVLHVLCFTRPRYQMSVYRTIGPLVAESSWTEILSGQNFCLTFLVENQCSYLCCANNSSYASEPV